MSAKDDVKALKPGDIKAYAFAHPVSEDARNALAVSLENPKVAELPARYIKLPCGSCKMELAASEEVVERVETGMPLRCPLCAAWLMTQVKLRAGGWAQIMGDKQEDDVAH